MKLHLSLIVFLALVSSIATGATTSDLPGKYYLEGIMEMGSILLIRPDQTFSGQIYFGTASGSANGTWHVEDGALILKPDSLSVPKPVVVNFDSLSETDLAQAEALNVQYKNEGFDAARDNYVLTMYYAPTPVLQILEPVTIYLEYAEGPPAEIQVDHFNADQLSFPVDEQRFLKRIGFRKQGYSGAVQWFEVDANNRLFNFSWEKVPGRRLSFLRPKEYDLKEAREHLNYGPEQIGELKRNYQITLTWHVEFIAPVIEPVEVHWGFQDGTVITQVWKDAKQSSLHIPFDEKKTLKRIGFKTQGSAKPIIGVEVTPTGRMFSMEWAEPFVEGDSDIGGLFDNMLLDIKPGCLAWDEGNETGCFRK
jgi:hypothetical protein